jgi:hypothetical protein
MDNPTPPVFILGAPRSGTTFLASLLENTGYGPPFETQFIIKYFKRLTDYGNVEEFSVFKCLLSDILSERAVMQWDLQLDIKEFYDEMLPNVTYARIVDKLCLKASAKNGYSSWGDKTPHYVGELDILLQLFPDSKYIYIVRDGRDVSLSLFERDWGPNNVYYSAEYWKYLNREQPSFQELDRYQLYSLKYEDLLDDVCFYINEIYGFLEVSDLKEANLLSLIGSVKKGNYNKWQARMTTTQIKVFESIAADTLERFGYPTSYKEQQVSAVLKLWYKLHDSIHRIKHLFIINVVDGIKIRFFGKRPFAE